jgi:hypothetical protein
MQAITVCKRKREAIVLVIRERCCSVGRRNLVDVDAEEVVVLLRCNATGVFICRLRGMTYKVCLKEQSPSFGIFDPVTVIKGGTRVKNGHLARSLE